MCVVHGGWMWARVRAGRPGRASRCWAEAHRQSGEAQAQEEACAESESPKPRPHKISCCNQLLSKGNTAHARSVAARPRRAAAALPTATAPDRRERGSIPSCTVWPLPAAALGVRRALGCPPTHSRTLTKASSPWRRVTRLKPRALASSHVGAPSHRESSSCQPASRPSGIGAEQRSHDGSSTNCADANCPARPTRREDGALPACCAPSPEPPPSCSICPLMPHLSRWV